MSKPHNVKTDHVADYKSTKPPIDLRQWQDRKLTNTSRAVEKILVEDPKICGVRKSWLPHLRAKLGTRAALPAAHLLGEIAFQYLPGNDRRQKFTGPLYWKSKRALAADTGLTCQQVRDALTALERAGFIKTRTDQTILSNGMAYANALQIELVTQRLASISAGTVVPETNSTVPQTNTPMTVDSCSIDQQGCSPDQLSCSRGIDVSREEREAESLKKEKETALPGSGSSFQEEPSRTDEPTRPQPTADNPGPGQDGPDQDHNPVPGQDGPDQDQDTVHSPGDAGPDQDEMAPRGCENTDTESQEDDRGGLDEVLESISNTFGGVALPPLLIQTIKLNWRDGTLGIAQAQALTMAVAAFHDMPLKRAKLPWRHEINKSDQKGGNADPRVLSDAEDNKLRARVKNCGTTNLTPQEANRWVLIEAHDAPIQKDFYIPFNPLRLGLDWTKSWNGVAQVLYAVGGYDEDLAAVERMAIVVPGRTWKRA